MEKYVVLLFSAVDPHIHSLCHYLPLEWLKTRRSWPPGDYLLPIGKRGQPISSSTASKFSCPTGFHRILHEYATYEEEFDSRDRGSDVVPTSTVNLHFCQRNHFNNATEIAPSNVSWPKGDYCVIVNGAICPPEMRELFQVLPGAHKIQILTTRRSYLRFSTLTIFTGFTNRNFIYLKIL